MSFVSAFRVQAARRLLAQLVVVAAVVLGIGDGAADVPAGDLTKFESIVFLSDSTHAYLFDKKTDASIEVVDVATGRRLGDPLGQNAMPPALKLGTAALAEKRIDFRGGPLSANPKFNISFFISKSFASDRERFVKPFLARADKDSVVRRTEAKRGAGCIHVKIVRNNIPIEQLTIAESSNTSMLFGEADLDYLHCVASMYMFAIGVENYLSLDAGRSVAIRKGVLPHDSPWLTFGPGSGGVLGNLYKSGVASGTAKAEVLKRVSKLMQTQTDEKAP